MLPPPCPDPHRSGANPQELSAKLAEAGCVAQPDAALGEDPDDADYSVPADLESGDGSVAAFALQPLRCVELGLDAYIAPRTRAEQGRSALCETLQFGHGELV